MKPNISKYKKDFDNLVNLGNDLLNAMKYACYPIEFQESINRILQDKTSDYLKSLPDFEQQYQTWYSESKIFIKQLLPDRLEDFIRYYEKPRTRKEISCENYKIEDYLQGLSLTRGITVIAGPKDAISLY